jgi:ABC-type Zn uptake system ZnuABC Zn-binding protein ZnuA
MKFQMWRRVLLAVGLGLLVPAAFVACGDDDGSDSDLGDGGELTVVASTTIVADWVKNVGGERVSVSSIVPVNTDVHSYVVLPSDVRRIGEADAVFLIGESLESGFESEVRENANGPVIELAEGLALRPFAESHTEDVHEHEDEGHSDEDGHDHGEFDPHIFMDIDLTIGAVENIRDALVELDADGADTYNANAETYIAGLRELDEEISEMLSDLPEERRYLVTFHDGYGYFAERYGLDEQPAASRVAELVSEIRAHNVEFIFAEPQFNAQILEQIANDTGAQVRRIPSDALSHEVPDYFSLMRAIASGIAN